MPNPSLYHCQPTLCTGIIHVVSHFMCNNIFINSLNNATIWHTLIKFKLVDKVIVEALQLALREFSIAINSQLQPLSLSPYHSTLHFLKQRVNIIDTRTSPQFVYFTQTCY